MSNHLSKFYKEQFTRQHELLQMTLDALNGLELAVPPISEITVSWAKRATLEHGESTRQRAASYARRVEQIKLAWPEIEWILIDPDEAEIAATVESLEAAIAAKISQRRKQQIANNE